MSQNDSVWHNEFITFIRVGSGDLLSSDEIVSPNEVHIPGKKYIDFPKEGLSELRRIYNSEGNLSSFNLTRISTWAAYFGDPEFAFDALERGTGITTGLVHCWFPVMKEVRQLPRFKEYMKEIGLVDYWNEFGWPDLCRPVGDDDFECD